MMFPLIMVFGIIYFLIIRPQNKRQKAHQAMIDALRRGDSVITQGGLVGKVTKVEDDEVQVEIANDTRVTVIRSMIISIRSKTEPVEKK
jgi:preprotein translocase subunit YajC